MNISLFYILFEFSRNAFIAKIALFLSYTLIYLIPIILIVWAIFYVKRKMFSFSLLFLSGIFSWVTAALLKLIFHMPRPFMKEGITSIVSETGFSFPSEHMAVFSGLAFALYFLNKKLGGVLFILALLIGLSRIVLGVHYPVDIIGGFLTGYIVSFVIIYFFKKI